MTVPSDEELMRVLKHTLGQTPFLLLYHDPDTGETRCCTTVRPEGIEPILETVLERIQGGEMKRPRIYDLTGDKPS